MCDSESGYGGTAVCLCGRTEKNDRCRRKTAAAEKLWHAAESICTLLQEISGVQSAHLWKGRNAGGAAEGGTTAADRCGSCMGRLPKGCPELYPFRRNVCFAVKL